MAPVAAASVPSSSSISFEARHVHLVYEHIASDFSRTRHSTWPFVQEWLQRLRQGSLVLDAGCGNGKYLGVDSVLSSSDRPGPIPHHIVHKNASSQKGKDVSPTRGSLNDVAPSRSLPVSKESGPAEKPIKARDLDSSLDPTTSTMTQNPKAILSIGLDMSLGLLSIASKDKGHEVVRGDCFDLSCWRTGAFDHAISIATIHHFATEARRIEAVKQLIKAVRPSPFKPKSNTSYPNSPNSSAAHKILIVVWALEQDPSLSGFGSARKKGKVKGGAVRVDRFKERVDGRGVERGEVSEDGHGEGKIGREDERDVFVPWELQRKDKVEGKGRGKGQDRKKGKERQERQDKEEEEESTVTGEEAGPIAKETPAKAKHQTFQRYYHLFKKGELTELVKAATKALGARFEDALNGGEDGEESGGMQGVRIGGEEEEVLWVSMKEERWERENWVGDIEVALRKAPAQRV